MYRISCAETGNPTCEFVSTSDDLDVCAAQSIAHSRAAHPKFFELLSTGKTDAEVLSMTRSMARTS